MSAHCLSRCLLYQITHIRTISPAPGRNGTPYMANSRDSFAPLRQSGQGFRPRLPPTDAAWAWPPDHATAGYQSTGWDIVVASDFGTTTEAGMARLLACITS